MGEEANKVEALLFSSGRKMSEEELGKIIGLKQEKLKEALEELRRKYESEESPLILFNEGDSWKLTTKERYLGLVQNIVTETELDKSLMETLAVIAWKYPILQADVIKIRNNKAYEHLKELEEAGFIAREKKGRTRTIKLTPKFFEYFDLPPSKAKTQEAFKEVVPEEIREGVEKTEQEIQSTEEEIEEVKKKKEELEQKMKEEKEKKKTEEPEIDIVDELRKKTKLDVYESKEEEPKPEKQKLGSMEVYGEGEGAAPGAPKITESAAEKRATEIEKEETTPEVEAEIEKMIHPKTEPEKPSFGNEGEKEAAEAQKPEEEIESEKEEEELMPEEKEETKEAPKAEKEEEEEGELEEPEKEKKEEEETEEEKKSEEE